MDNMAVSDLVLMLSFCWWLHIDLSTWCCWVLFWWAGPCMFWIFFWFFLEVLFCKILQLNYLCLGFYGLLRVVLLYPSIWISFLWMLWSLLAGHLIYCIILGIVFLLFFQSWIWKLGWFFSQACHLVLICLRISFFQLSFCLIFYSTSSFFHYPFAFVCHLFVFYLLSFVFFTYFFNFFF